MARQRFFYIFIICVCLEVLTHMPGLCSNKDNQAVLKLRDEAEIFFKQGIETKNSESANAFFSSAKDKYSEISAAQNNSNGYVIFNIGNCYYMMKQYGAALLYYRKAERFIPNDKNLKSNISATIKNLDDSIAKPQINKVLEIIFFWHYLYDLNLRITVFLIAISVFFAAITARIFRRFHFLNWIKTASAIVCLCVFGSIAYQYYLDKHNVRGVITAETVIGRKGNSESYEPSFNQPLNEGVEFKLIQEKGEWFNIKLDNGSECWIEKNAAGII
ncbi:MAG TPA: tetratricopeptide repeat protein [bacterium]|nr:tetratricopeptide repeat protein [bacterium]HPN29387.1 tetratricopeptide repeat protein [bacterium]